MKTTSLHVLWHEAVLDEDKVHPPWPAARALGMVAHAQHVFHPVASSLHDALDVRPVPPGELHSQHPVRGKVRGRFAQHQNSIGPLSKPLYQARESSLVPLRLLTVHFLQKM